MHFLVSHKYKFMMGWSAKCGCSSLKRWYLDIHGIKMATLDRPVYEVIGYGDTEYTYVEWENPAKYRDYKKYVTVRNPYSRLVSGYVNKYVATREFPNYGWNTFNEFLGALENDRYYRKVEKHHFCPQFSEAYTYFNKAGFKFDTVLQLENLELGLQKISSDRGIPYSRTPTANQTNYSLSEFAAPNVADLVISAFGLGNIPPFECFYTHENVKVVKRIYKTDFKMLRSLGIDYLPSYLV